MLDLPHGTVTFLFTDIEGSTRLLHALGEQYAHVLSEHRRLLRNAFEENLGREIDTQGDSFFVAFGDPRNAVGAAIASQRALADHSWPDGAAVLVRMGIHTGEPLLAGDHYVGLDVHRGARIAAAAHGAQILVSDRTRELLVDGFDSGATLRELGAHRLKDIPEPERLFQVVVEGLPSSFPPPRVQESAPAAAGLPDYSLPPADVPCPYKGLLRFEREDTDLFFGREELVENLVSRLDDSPFLAVVGPSGSGKSSLVRAGILPELERRTGSGAALVVEPGEHPLSRVAETYAGEVLVVDQFEEVFTLCRDEDERRAFIERLLDAAGRGVRVIVALRADFYGRCASYDRLATTLEEHQALIGPMTEEELRRAIERPAERAGLALEPGLVEGILRDVVGEPGALPLLSHSLLETWRRRSDRMLSLIGYLQSGGVQGAIAKTAETVYHEALTPEHQALARNIFLRLTELGEGTEATRRRVRLSELVPRTEQATDVDQVLRVLVEARLVTTSDGTVEVAHEALIRHWPTLRAWLDQDREGMLLQRRLTVAAQEWESLGREAGALYRGVRLAGAIEWANDHDDELNELEREFLRDSRAAELSEFEAARRRNRRLRVLVGALALLLAGALAAGAVAVVQRQNAKRAESAAIAQRLGAQALVEPALDRGLLLARQGVELDDSVETRSNLLATLSRSPAAIAVLRGDGDAVVRVTLSGDGRTLAHGDDDGTVMLVDTASGRRVGGPYTVPGRVTAISFSPGGELLAVGGLGDGGGFLRLVERQTGEVHRELAVPSGRIAETLLFSADGSRLTGSLILDTDEGNEPSLIRRWETSTGRRLATDVVADIAYDGLALARGGKWLVSAGVEETVIRDAASLRVLRRLGVGAGASGAAAVAPDGLTVAFGHEDGSLSLLDVRGGKVRRATGRHEAGVTGIGFGSDGRTVVTAGDDRNVIVWDVAAANARETMRGHAARAETVAVARDGRTAYTGSLDGSIFAWDLTGRRRLVRTFDLVADGSGPNPRPALGLSGDRRLIAHGTPSGAVVLRRLPALGAVGRPLRGYAGQLLWVALSPDGRRLAAVGNGAPGVIWDLERPERARPLIGWRTEGSGFAAFSPDGTILATSGAEGVELWNVESRRRIGSLDRRDLAEVAFSPDGKTLAAAGAEGKVVLWRLDGRTRLRTLVADEKFATSLRFSPDGSILAAGGFAGEITLFDVGSGERIGKKLTGHTGVVIHADFDSSGSLLVSSSTDGKVRLWDVATQRQLGSGEQASEGAWNASRFVLDGTTVLAFYENGRALLWDVRPESWNRHACGIVGRPLTRAEWTEFLPERAYKSVCSLEVDGAGRVRSGG